MTGLALLAGFPLWGEHLTILVDQAGPLYLHGEPGAGLSTLATWLAERRGGALLDDAEQLGGAAVLAWLAENPRGTVASHLEPSAPALAEAASRCLVFRLPSLEEAPAALARALEAMAQEEGLSGPLPPALACLPCPGNLRGLRNRLVRFKLLGQLPEAYPAGASGSALPLDNEDLASNLHVLERLLLHRALRRSCGNRVEAAQRLGVSRRQLYLLIARHGDPVRGQPPGSDLPKRLSKRRDQNSSVPPLNR